MKKIIVIIALLVFYQASFTQVNLFTKNTMTGTKYGAVSETGDTLLKAEYDEIFKFNGIYFSARKGELCGIVDTTGKVIIPFQYDFITNIFENRVFVGKGKKMALADDKGKLLTQFIYDNAWNFSEGIAKVEIDEKVGYVNKSGIAIIPVKFKDGSNYCQYGKVTVHLSNWNDLGTYKLTYWNGKTEIYDAGYSSDYPLILDNKGTLLYKGTNEDITFDSSGYIIMTKYDSKYCGKSVGQILDPKGKVVFPFNNCCEFEFKDKFIKLYSLGNGKYGALSYQGVELLKPNFSSISDFSYGSSQYAKVSFEDNSFFYINDIGKCIEFDGVTCPE